MKLEKLSENQIRCTLSRDDLSNRELRLSELAYGTEKAKELFRDMMQQASYEFGFEADDIPLMIEAIPVSMECLVLVITKVEDPDELDTRFSKFSPDNSSTESYEDNEEDPFTDEIINCFEQLDQFMSTNNDSNPTADFIPLPDALGVVPKAETEEPVQKTPELLRVYSFPSLEDASRIAPLLADTYFGTNSLYKDPINGIYYLTVANAGHSSEEFSKICSILSEYGKLERTSYASMAYYAEHYEVIIKDKALQILASL